MTSKNNAFNIEGPSLFGEVLKRTQRAPKKPAPPITYSTKPAHHLRPLDRTQNINTQRVKARQVYSAE